MTTPKIILSREFDKPDELETEWGLNYVMVVERTKSQSESQLGPSMAALASSSPEQLSSVITGLLYGILVEQSSAPRYLKALGSVTRDQYVACVDPLRRLIQLKLHRMLDLPRSQAIWLVSMLVQAGAMEADTLVLALIRHMMTGNTSPKNLSLVNEVLNICTSNRDWLYEKASLIPIVAYSFTTLVTDHHRAELEALREREVGLVVQLCRERLEQVRSAGRDFIRVLYNISLIPEIKKVWDQVIMAPSGVGEASITSAMASNSSTSSNAISSSQPSSSSQQPSTMPWLKVFLSTPTPKSLLLSRISPEIESWLTFVFTQVKSGMQGWYQKWFATKYFTSPEAETMVPDILRWIIGVHHPTNQILQSNILPRYKFIGWLLGGLRNPHVLQTARQALFFDWLCYVPARDNIMNIEPGALLIMNTLQKEPAFVAALADYLMASTDTFLFREFPPMREDTRRSVHLASKLMVDKKVIPTFDPLFNNAHLAQPLRDALRKVFDNMSSKQLQHQHNQHQSVTPPPTSRTQDPNPPSVPSIQGQNQHPLPAHGSSISTTPPSSASTSPMPTPEPSPVNSPRAPLNGSKREPNLDSPGEIRLPTTHSNKDSPTFTDKSNDFSMFDGWKAALSSSGGSNSGTIVSSSSMDVDLPTPLVSQSKEIDITSTPSSRFAEHLKVLSTRVEVGNVRLARESFDTFLTQPASPSVELSEVNDLASKLLDILANELLENMNDPTTHFSVFSAPNNFVHTQLFATLVELYNDSESDRSASKSFVLSLVAALRELESSFSARLLCFLLSNQLPSNSGLSIANDYSNETEAFETLISAEEELKTHEEKDEEEQKLSTPPWLLPYRDLLKLLIRDNAKQSHLEVLQEILVADLAQLAQLSVRLFNHLIPLICRYLPDLVVGNVAFIRLALNSCLPTTVGSIHAGLSSQTFQLFGNQLITILKDSLNWNSYAQQILWSMVASEYLFQTELVIDTLAEFLPTLDPLKSQEALQGSLGLISLIGPTPKIVTAVLSMQIQAYSFSIAVFVRWMVEEGFQEELTKRLPPILTSFNKQSSSQDQQPIRRAMMHLALIHGAIPSEIEEMIENSTALRRLFSQSIKSKCSEPAFAALTSAFMDKEDKEKTAETKKGSKKRVHKDVQAEVDEDLPEESVKAAAPPKTKKKKEKSD